jgi:hypothetical protein
MISTPWHLLTATATITNIDWTSTNSGLSVGVPPAEGIEVVCMMQPVSAGDALVYGRDTTSQMYDVFLSPTDSTGAAWDCSPRDTIAVGGVTYRVAGKPRDLCTFGVVKHLVVELDTN